MLSPRLVTMLFVASLGATSADYLYTPGQQQMQQQVQPQQQQRFNGQSQQYYGPQFMASEYDPYTPPSNQAYPAPFFEDKTEAPPRESHSTMRDRAADDTPIQRTVPPTPYALTPTPEQSNRPTPQPSTPCPPKTTLPPLRPTTTPPPTTPVQTPPKQTLPPITPTTPHPGQNQDQNQNRQTQQPHQAQLRSSNSSSSSSGSNVWIAGIVVGSALVAIGAVFAVKRRRRNSAPPTPPPPRSAWEVVLTPSHR